MLKALAGDLSATFNLDGGHLSRYVQRRKRIFRSLCDQLLLHDQILIPTHDYLTAAGLIWLLGERNVISLLDSDRLRFVRLQGVFCYIRGTGPDGGVVAMEDPTKKRPQDSRIEDSVEAALTAIKGRYSEHRLLVQLLHRQSQQMRTSAVVDAIRKDAFADLEQTTHWKESYRYSSPDLLKLPGVGSMEARVLGPGTNVSRHVIDALLALTLMNMELYLSESLGCDSTSTGSPIGDCVALKLPRLDRDRRARPHLWTFLDIAGIPDLSNLLLADMDSVAQFLEISSSGDAVQFRRWFHSNANLSEREILQAYIGLLHGTPWAGRLPSKALRFVITTAAGLVPGLGPIVGPTVGAAASAVDTFVVDKILRGKSPKFFVDDLRKFSGKIMKKM